MARAEVYGEMPDGVVTAVEMTEEDLLSGDGDGYPRGVVGEVEVFRQQEVLVSIALVAVGEDFA